MRKLRTLTIGLVIVMTLSGCANLRARWSTWGSCAIGGAVVGAALGGAGGGIGVHNIEANPTGEERAAGIAAGIIPGALIGAVIGHMICDPVETPPPPPPVVQAAPPPPPPPPAKGTKLATVGEANFDFDRAELKSSARDVLASAVRTLQDNPDTRVVVEGHTDSVGSEAYNQRLSELRAEAVRDYLARNGIESSRISTRGYGESRPVASNQTAEGRAQNRRAEVVAD